MAENTHHVLACTCKNLLRWEHFLSISAQCHAVHPINADLHYLRKRARTNESIIPTNLLHKSDNHVNSGGIHDSEESLRMSSGMTGDIRQVWGKDLGYEVKHPLDPWKHHPKSFIHQWNLIPLIFIFIVPLQEINHKKKKWLRSFPLLTTSFVFSIPVLKSATITAWRGMLPVFWVPSNYLPNNLIHTTVPVWQWALMN